MRSIKSTIVFLLILSLSNYCNTQPMDTLKSNKEINQVNQKQMSEVGLFDFQPLSVQDTLALLSFIVLITGTIYAYNQYNESKKSRIQTNYIKTVEYLQESEFVKARNHVQSKLKNKEFSDWSEEDISFAEIVCRKYDTVCLMNERLGMTSNLNEIASKWQHSIKNCYFICKPLITKYQGERDKNFWNHFSKLNILAVNSNSDTDTLT